MPGSEKFIQDKRAGEALRESEEHYRAVAEAATDGIITINSESTILLVNPAAEKIFGYSIEEMVGRQLTMLMPDYLRHVHRSGIARYLATGHRHIEWAAVQLFGLHKNGNEIALEISFLEFIKGSRRFFTGIVRDISERKLMEEKQRRLARHAVLQAEVSAAFSDSERTLSAILQVCTEAVVQHLDAAFARIWTLNGGENLLDLQASAGLYTNLDGQHAHVPIGSYKIGLIARERKPHLTNNVLGDERVTDKDWARREGMVSFAGYPLMLEDHLVGVIAMFARSSMEPDTIEALESVALIIAQGIERKRAHDALRESQRLVQAIFDNSPAIIHVKDLDGHFLLVNRSFEQVVGLTPQEILGKTSFDLFSENNARAYHDVDRKVIETGSALETEEVLTTEQGDRIFLTTKSPLYDEDGKPYALFGISTEITEHKLAEATLQETRAELAHFNRVMTVGELTTSIANEINQPLASIVMNGNAALRWLELDPPNIAKARASTDLIIRDGDRASQVISRIRALLKKAPPIKSLLDVNEFVRDAIALTQNEIIRDGILLRTDLATGLPQVPGDRTQLQQVMLDLIFNAIEAMRGIKDRQRELLIMTRRETEADVRVTVCDSGPGFNAETSDRLFDPFFTTKPEGMGVGLAISRSIIEAHGGRFTAGPNDPFGANFQFTLPLDAQRLS
jgi:PAS domain S-box-containing protein